MMQRTLFAIALAVAVACRTKEPAHAPDPSGPVLFDGQSLAGWHGDARFWRVENGCIVGESTAERPCDATTYLVRRGLELGDFELSLAFKITGGNSGVQFRSAERGEFQVAGFQADIEDGQSWTGCLYEQDGAGVVATRGQSVHLGGKDARRESFADAGELLAKMRVHDWNRYVIRARGSEVELELNGHRTALVRDRRPERRLRGLVALQLHAGAPMRVEFKDLACVELPPVEPEPVVIALAPVAPSDAAERPQWIWSSPATPDGDLCALVRRFHVARVPERVLLRAAADNHARLFVNGELALVNDDWGAPVEVDATRFLRAGENEVAVIARNEGGPAAVWVELLGETNSARALRIVTDTSWSAARVAPGTPYDAWLPSEFAAARAAAPHSFGSFGVAPWGGSVAASAVEEQALAASELTLLPGFRAELLYSVPKSSQGSWVALCDDPRGRFYACDQYGGLYRVSVGASAADTRVEPLALDLGRAHGLCWASNALYVVASERDDGTNGLYRVTDSDGDDVLDSAQLLRAFEGRGEHGPHAVVRGYDGDLWIVGGNHAPLPEPIDEYWRPKNWDEDILLPRIEDPNGHAVGIRAPGGWVVRTDREAKRWELWACGFRNAYDVAVDESGELFTFDSDMEWDVGTPWYQPTRIFHVARGADFGWRGGPGKMPPDYPDTLPSVCDIGLSSPTGVAFGYRAKFPAKYRRALFALDWSYGTIYAVHLTAEGASFTGRFERFATGKPFPVTDVVFAADGAMYLTTGGRRTQSGLYRITFESELREADRDAEDRLVAQYDLYAGRREHVRSLAEWPLGTGTGELRPDVLRGELADQDRFVRHAARTRIERLGRLDYWAERTTNKAQAHIERILSCIHIGGDGARDLVTRELDALAFDTYDSEMLVAVARLYALALIRLPPDEAARTRFRERWESRYPSGSTRLDREVLQLLVALESPRAVEPALRVLEVSATQEERIWAAYCLSVAKSGWARETRERFFRAVDALHASAKGGHSLVKYVERIRARAVELLSDAERAELGSLIEPPVATSAATAPSASFVRAWTTDELVPELQAELRGRDFEAGRKAYAKANCAACHRIAGEGGATGPDLTGAGARFSRRDLLEALLEPSKVISDQYQDTEVLTKDGEFFVGRVERDDATAIALRRLPPQDDLVEVARGDIEHQRPHRLSRMPSGLIDVLERDEILDLFAYVLSGADRTAPAFER